MDLSKNQTPDLYFSTEGIKKPDSELDAPTHSSRSLLIANACTRSGSCSFSCKKAEYSKYHIFLTHKIINLPMHYATIIVSDRK